MIKNSLGPISLLSAWLLLGVSCTSETDSDGHESPTNTELRIADVSEPCGLENEEDCDSMDCDEQMEVNLSGLEVSKLRGFEFIYSHSEAHGSNVCVLVGLDDGGRVESAELKVIQNITRKPIMSFNLLYYERYGMDLWFRTRTNTALNRTDTILVVDAATSDRKHSKEIDIDNVDGRVKLDVKIVRPNYTWYKEDSETGNYDPIDYESLAFIGTQDARGIADATRYTGVLAEMPNIGGTVPSRAQIKYVPPTDPTDPTELGHIELRRNYLKRVHDVVYRQGYPPSPVVNSQPSIDWGCNL